MKNIKPRLGSQIDRATQPFPVNSYPKGYVFNIFIQEVLESPEDFIEAITALNMAGQDDDVVVHLNCDGGSLDAVDTLLFEMSKCQGHIHIKASGTIASAATLILLAGHSYEMSPYTNILFHSSSFAYGGKAQDVVEYSAFAKKQTEALMRDYYKNILSEDELHDIFVNKREFWLNAEDFCKRFEDAQEKAKQEQQQREKEVFEDMFGTEIPDTILNKLTKSQLVSYIKGDVDINIKEDGSFTLIDIENDESDN